MKVIKASTKILSATDNLEQIIELAGRVCYKSEDKITDDSASAFIERLKNLKHESVLEHGSISVLFTVDRGISHELVRHRLASFSQESTRYCNYSKGKFSNEITVIDPRPAFPNMNIAEFHEWYEACAKSEQSYLNMLDVGAKAQLARSVLPTSLKTDLVITANPREWRHIFRLRCSNDAHPQMREVMIPLLANFISRWPSIFEDIPFGTVD